MQHYRLLRNNSESGPYTQQDLIELGLKAYDLIWMEGKSSSWKYPSEVESLKSFAPPITEDLYVSFHTPKLVKQAIGNAIISKSGITGVQKSPMRRYVSVILPTTISTHAEKTISKPVAESVVTEKMVAEKESGIVGNFKADSSIAFSEPTPYRSYKRYIMAGTFLVILTTGIYFGTATHQKPIGHPDNADRLPESLVSLTNSITEDKESAPVISLPPNRLLDFAALKRFVQVSEPQYQVGYFGGIADLKLTVKNTGKSTLTNIVIAVDYLNNNRTIDHTENVAISALDPNKSISVSAPESQEGIAIRTRVIGISNLSAE